MTLTYHIVYNNLSEDEKQQIYTLWKGVLPIEEQKRRIDSVAIALKDQDKIVGVSSVYVGNLAQKQYYFLRIFVSPKYRNRIINVQGDNFITYAKSLLQENNKDNCCGVAVYLESKTISSKLMKKFGLEPFQTKNNLIIWYCDFNV